MPVRIPVVAMVLVLGLTCGVVAVAVVSAPAGVPSAPGRSSGREVATTAGDRYAVSVLHAWDARRAAAWADGDRTALARLYTPGSPAGAADVELLRRYLARGVVVRDLRMQVLRARVLVTRPGRLVLEVTDRVAAATAVRAGDEAVRRRLPADTPTTRRLELRHDAGGWRMAGVSAASASADR